MNGIQQSLKKEQVDAIRQETKERSLINNYYQEIVDNAKILAELGVYDEIKACQRALAGLPMDMIPFTPGFSDQSNVIDYLPESLQHVVLHLSAKTKFDSLTCTISVIMAIVIALYGRFRIHLEPGWDEAVLLYCMMIAASGENKDSLINMVRDILDEAMNELQADYDRNVLQMQLKYKNRKEAFKCRFHAEIKKIVKACDNSTYDSSDYGKFLEEVDKLSEQAGVIQQNIQSSAPGARPNLRFSIVTEQGLIKILAKQGGCQAAIEAEAGFIGKILTLGARFNIDPLLIGYEQSDYLPGNAHNQIHLIKLSLNLFYFAQPVIGSKFFRKYAAEERGLAPRFIPIFPDKHHIPATIRDDSPKFQFFADTLKSILKYNFTQDLHREVNILEVTSAANARLKEFQGENQALIKNGNEHIGAPLKKLHGKACRIAGVLYLWECFVNGSIGRVISDHAIEAGIAIAKYFIPHINHAFSPAGLIGVDPADRILRWIMEANMATFDYRTIKSAITSELNGELINAGLQRLISCHILAKIHDPEGRPVYVVNPQLNGYFTPFPMMPSMVPLIPPTTEGGLF